MMRILAFLTTLICLPLLIVGLFFACIILKIVGFFGASKLAVVNEKVNFIIGRLAFYSTLSRIRVHGLDRIGGISPVVIYSNHLSFADIPILSGFVLPSAIYVARKGLILSPLITVAGGVLIERKSSKKELKNIREIVAKIKAGRSFIIFPEGTRSRDGRLGELKTGSIKIAGWAGVPAVPVRIEGSRRLLPRGAFLPRPTRVEVFIGDPILTRDEDEMLSGIKAFLMGNVDEESS